MVDKLDYGLHSGGNGTYMWLLNPAVPVLKIAGNPGVKTFVWLSNIGNYFFVIAACTAGKGGQCSLHSWVKYFLGIQRRIQLNVCPPPQKNTRYIRPVPYTESKGHIHCTCIGSNGVEVGDHYWQGDAGNYTREMVRKSAAGHMTPSDPCS